MRMSPKTKGSKIGETLNPKNKDELSSLSLDSLQLKIISLRVYEEQPPVYAIKVVFSENLLISAVIRPLGLEDKDEKESILAKGTFLYEPSNYEKMCQFADQPLIVKIQPMPSVETEWTNPHVNTPTDAWSNKPAVSSRPTNEPHANLSFCNIDILRMFLGTDKLCVKRRMELMVPLTYRNRQSWDNLPLLKMSITAVRNEVNAHHNEILYRAIWMKTTLIGMYNLSEPYLEFNSYSAATKMPVYNEHGASDNMVVTFANGQKTSTLMENTSFYPKWELLRSDYKLFANSDEKFECSLEDIYNDEENLDVEYYLKEAPSDYSVTWGSFRRSLLMGKAKNRFWHHQQQWKWPFEFYIHGTDMIPRSYMAFMDLTPLLYPGVNRVVMAAPLCHYDTEMIKKLCNCPTLMVPLNPISPRGKSNTDPLPIAEDLMPSTGGNGLPAFALIEVSLAQPLVPEVLPAFISRNEIEEMLATMVEECDRQPICNGRGQLVRDWKDVVRSAANALRKLPYHGLTDFCNMNRQLSETRIRVEMMTSFWMEAAPYINNNFLVANYLENKELFEELLILAHVNLLKTAGDTLVGVETFAMHPALRAARHARQLFDVPHAVELYMLAAVRCSEDSNTWRELSTCLKDVDRDWAAVCLSKALNLDTRHPLNILSKACMIFETDPDGAEPFFDALLGFYPFWGTAYIICQAYYTSREYFKLADIIGDSWKLIHEEHFNSELPLPRTWEKELGDFWESTHLLTGMSPFYDAADLLLRIRAIRMAEVCLGLALAESGETAPYCHLVALCYRLRGDIDNALCFVRKAIKNHGENTYLCCMEGECLHQNEDVTGAMKAFAKVGGGTNAYSILLSLPCWDVQRVRQVVVDLLRRQPSAYAWMALANDWLLRSKSNEKVDDVVDDESVGKLKCAIACAEQALKFDRRAGRAWALLSMLVKPSKRAFFCGNMAIETGFPFNDDIDEYNLQFASQEAICHRIGTTLRECRCDMCILLQF